MHVNVGNIPLAEQGVSIGILSVTRNQGLTHTHYKDTRSSSDTAAGNRARPGNPDLTTER